MEVGLVWKFEEFGKRYIIVSLWLLSGFAFVALVIKAVEGEPTFQIQPHDGATIRFVNYGSEPKLVWSCIFSSSFSSSQTPACYFLHLSMIQFNQNAYASLVSFCWRSPGVH